MTVGPAVNAPVTLIYYLGSVAWLGLYLDVAGLGNVDLQLLIQHRADLVEVIAGPELIGRQRIDGGTHKLVFQHISRAQRWHADNLFVEVRVNRSVGSGGQVLYSRLLRGYDGAVRLADPHMDDIQLVAGRAVANFELAQALHATLTNDFY